MSTIHQQTSHHLGHFETEDEDGLLRGFSSCPSCRGPFGLALILPCSHPMCGPCVAAAAAGAGGAGSRVGPPVPGPNPCPVPCPCCRRPVELPCRVWASAVSCLPEYPELSSGRITGATSAASGRNQKKDVSNGHRSSVTLWADGDVDLHDEEMKQSVFGLHFALDSSHIPSFINLSDSFMTVTCKTKSQTRPSVQPMAVLSGDVLIRLGQYYWEVDVCNSALYRIGVRSRDGSWGWWFERRGPHFSSVYDGAVEPVCSVPPGIKTVGLFLNVNGGALSFYNALSREHLVTLPTRFHPGGVVPAFALGQGRLKLRTGLAPNPLVFHGRDSGYRRARGAEGGSWRRGVAFGSVKKVVEKFEELGKTGENWGKLGKTGEN